jgi:TolB protein
MDIISGTVLTITTEADAHYPTWSPDNTQIAYTHYDPENEDWFIYIAPADGTNPPRQVRQGEWPNWGPGGLLSLTGCNGDNHCGIYVYDPVTGTSRRLTQYRQDRAGAWSPSGDEIAYTTDLGFSFNLIVVNVNSGFVRQVTKNLFTDVLPVWSPDGQRIAYLTDRHDDWSVYTVHPYGGQEERIVSMGAESADWLQFRLAWVAKTIQFPE